MNYIELFSDYMRMPHQKVCKRLAELETEPLVSTLLELQRRAKAEEQLSLSGFVRDRSLLASTFIEKIKTVCADYADVVSIDHRA